jgi:hypothetical protein
MSFDDFMAAQAANVQALSDEPHFASLVPLVDRMYRCIIGLAARNYSPTLMPSAAVSPGCLNFTAA